MTCKGPDSGWRATFLATALFAITLNMLQPLAHAVLLRGGAPAALWTTFCRTAAAEPGHAAGSGDTHGALPHECCLGLPHAQALIDPSRSFLPAALPDPVTLTLTATKHITPVGIRDGPHRTRAPPFLLA